MKRPILDAATAALKLERMAFEILEDNQEEKELILAGIASSGASIARHIKALLHKLAPIKIHTLEIRLDKKHPSAIELSQDMDLNDKVIIVVDDVSNSGRTILYALKPLLEYHPRKIRTLVLVERTHKGFPVRSDYVGLSVATTLQEHIVVEVEEGNVKGAFLE